jgi:hypothetical protein
MGYIVAVIVLLVVIVLAAFFLPGRPGRRGQLPSDHPLEVEKPAADEPTPSRSSTASQDQIRQAQKRVPPA